MESKIEIKTCGLFVNVQMDVHKNVTHQQVAVAVVGYVIKIVDLFLEGQTHKGNVPKLIMFTLEAVVTVVLQTLAVAHHAKEAVLLQYQHRKDSVTIVVQPMLIVKQPVQLVQS
jgi:hypothetical protein